MVVKCEWCGILHEKIESKVMRAIRNNHKIYCGKPCMKEAQAYNKKNKPKVTEAAKKGNRTYRKRAFAAYGSSCKVCGYSIRKVLQVHHIDENRTNNALSNLCVLCPTHHVEVHKRVITLNDY